MADVIYTIELDGHVVEVQAPEGTPEDQLRSEMEGMAASSPDGPMSWAQVPGEALANAVPSAVELSKSIVQPLLHPIKTAQGLAQLGGGILTKLGVASFDESAADAVGEYLVDRYGGIEQLKKTMAKDPAGFLTDVSVVLTGGGSLAVKAPGVVGKVGQVANTVGRTIDPLVIANKGVQAARATRAGQVAEGAARATGRGLATAASYPAALFSGVSPETVKMSVNAGRELNQALLRHQRGEVPITEPLEVMQRAMAAMRKERSDTYTANMKQFKNVDVPDFQAVEDAISAAHNVGMYKGVNLESGAAEVLDEVNAVVNKFKLAGATKTVEDLDKLKQAIYNIAANKPIGTPARAVANRVRNAVKDTIKKQSPNYTAVMEDYENMSETLTDLEKSLGLGDKTGVDAALRKLQSTTRNNATTNFGRRKQLLETLIPYDKRQGRDVPYMLAGQELSTATPRGLARLGGEGVGMAGFFNPAIWATLPLTSPRLVGEAGYALGRGIGAAERGASTLASKYGIGTMAPRIAAETGMVTQAANPPSLDEMLQRYLDEHPLQ